MSFCFVSSFINTIYKLRFDMNRPVVLICQVFYLRDLPQIFVPYVNLESRHYLFLNPGMPLEYFAPAEFKC
jgi:hypothetical protein